MSHEQKSERAATRRLSHILKGGSAPNKVDLCHLLLHNLYGSIIFGGRTHVRSFSKTSDICCRNEKIVPMETFNVIKFILNGRWPPLRSNKSGKVCQSLIGK